MADTHTTGLRSAPVLFQPSLRPNRPLPQSASDAQAYAAWLGAREGHRYRLPSAGELRAQP
ncbi:MAG: hypothetical protein EOP93_11125, partial [Lysobacteraceae bacterium]